MDRILEKQELIAWKNQVNRLPLLLRGARQVGKSFMVEQFGKAHFSSMVTINFELSRQYMACFDRLDPQSILKAITAINREKIIPGETLLFLDEIQICPAAIMAMRYFKEQMPELHLIAAGSLLEFALKEEGFSMPVGRIQSLYVKPMSFYEYLMASDHQNLVDYLQDVTIKEGINPAVAFKLETLLREYFVVGGMPAVVNEYLNTHSYTQLAVLQNALLTGYRDDFGKYSAPNKHKYLQRLIEKAPGLVGKHFRYSHVDPQMLSRDLRMAFDNLVDAGILYRVFASTASGLPLNSMMNEKKYKLLFLDIGLVKATSLLSPEVMLQKDLMLINQGVLVEQYVGQELLCNFPSYVAGELFYWERSKTGSMAEVDYVIQVDDMIVPLKVKAGKTGRLKSLHWFLENKPSTLGIKLSLDSLSMHKNILSVPLYMIAELPRLIARAQTMR